MLINTKLLAVSYAFPPLAYPRSIQVARLLKNLNVQTTLVCADEKNVKLDPTIEPDAEDYLENCIRIPFCFSGWGKNAGRIADRLYVPLWNKIPDQYRSWRRPVLKKISELSSDGYIPDVMVTFGAPMTSHLIGMEIKKQYRVPWIAHFSDPWIDNPFNNYDPLSRVINTSLERRVVETADRLVFTSQEQVNMVMAKYPKERLPGVRVIPHAFDHDLFPAVPEKSGSKIMIRHIGNFYGHRTPEPLFRALARICRKNKGCMEDVQIELYGHLHRRLLFSKAYHSLPQGLVTINPPVSYSRSLQLMRGSDILLAIDSPSVISVFLPSKLIDYIGSGRTILGITPPGTASNLIRQMGGMAADPEDIETVSSILLTAVEEMKNHKHTNEWGNEVVRSKYAARYVAGIMEGVIKELLP